MKIRKITGLVTLILIIGYGIFLYFISLTNAETIDLGEINDTVKKVEAAYLDKTINPENMDGYEVAFISDSDYQAKSNSAILNNCIVMDLRSANQIVGKVIFPSQNNREAQLKSQIIIIVTVTFVGILLLFYGIVLMIYSKVLKPFQSMKIFAAKVAEGDLDFRLGMDKDNNFGAFTESFDLMREELKHARQGEYQANLSKKELVASLSHDIKTPVATIKALCEIMEIKLKDDSNLKKINIIYHKADMIDVLISDMFHATLEELLMLKIVPSEELSSIISPMFQEINHFGYVELSNEIPDCMMICDKLRLGQVIDNVINNSYKYAGTKIMVHSYLEYGYLTIVIRDFGEGVEDTELPMVFEKYFRGKKVMKKEGSGLGLYLAKLFMEGMQGSIECFNDHGFVVSLHIKIV